MGIKKKTLAITAAAALTVATAVPALALENEFHGMFRLLGVVSNFDGSTTGEGFYIPDNKDKKAPTATYFEQRARLMYIAKANDDLKLVTHFEIDSRWGDNAYTTLRNHGGAIGADTVNIETKSVYLDFNVPNSGINVKAGIQPYNDSFKGILFDSDMAGVRASKTFGSLDTSLGWFRFADMGQINKTAWDMIALDTKYAVSKDLKVGASYYMINDDGSEQDWLQKTNAWNFYMQKGNTNITHTAGVNGEATFGPVTVDGFLVYQFGNLEAPVNRHVSAFAGNVGARAQVGRGTARTEFLYVSGDKGDQQGSTTNAFQSIFDESGYYSGNMQLLFRDAYAMTTDNAFVYSANNRDQGVIAGFLGYDLPITSKLSASANAGFAAVAKENVNKPVNLSSGQRNSSNYLGTELNASVDYKVYDNMTASVRGAYVILGDYYKGVAAGGEDPNNPYMTSVMLNYAF
ncbi:membrane protein [Geotalea uraniireducens]|uniref:Membrane protein n=1 Tax=Geotalea uraniireducens TaxID=351604 RepID=A0ABN6VM18_9BACT|nr:hypothetical protein [Geotalea uraniireducens]BDV41164.1 membrane protein [Geotalea uraniireducens]